MNEPFKVKLRRFDFLMHSRHSAAFYRVPESAAAIKVPHQALPDKFREFGDGASIAGGSRPHVSLGRTHGPDIGALMVRHLLNQDQGSAGLFAQKRNFCLTKAVVFNSSYYKATN